MVKVMIDFMKNVEKNASVYFEKSKKAKKKIKGAKEAIGKLEKQLKELKDKREKEVLKEKQEVKIVRKKEWYEKFRWFRTSRGFLVIGGRDATTNEIVIKKHTDKSDVVFHTDMTGSPFFVVKTEGKKIDEQSVKEVADATITFSRAWKLGITSSGVFWVNPEQVSKEAKAGEYLVKGAFMIRGKANYVDNQLNLAIGIKDNMIMGGPLSAVKKNCEKYVEIEQGNEKTSRVAKEIKKKIGGELDDIIRAMPAG